MRELPRECRRCRRPVFLILFSIAASVLLVMAVPARPEVVITHDEGGVLIDYVRRYQQLKESGERVVVDGPCYSACTVVLSLRNVCVTDRASFHFHAAYQEHCFLGSWCRRVIHEERTQYMLAMYPATVRRWIAARGGLGSDHLVMDSQEAIRHVEKCQ